MSARRNRNETTPEPEAEVTPESVTLETGDAVTPDGVTEPLPIPEPAPPDRDTVQGHVFFECPKEAPPVTLVGVETVEIPRYINVNMGHGLGVATDLAVFTVTQRGFAFGGGMRNVCRDASGERGTNVFANILGRVVRYFRNPIPGERASVDPILGVLRLVARTQRVMKPAAAAKATDTELRQAFGTRYARERAKAEAMLAPEESSDTE